MAEPENKDTEISWTPRPDPTLRTTEALLREISSIKELFETRLEAMDKAIALLQAAADKQPSIAEVAEHVVRLREVNEEKFKSVDQRFTESRNAITTALESAKEAVSKQHETSSTAISKSEQAFTKQLDSLGTFATSRIDDLRERVTSLEQHKKGMGDSWGFIAGGLGIVIAIASVAVAFVTAYRN